MTRHAVYRAARAVFRRTGLSRAANATLDWWEKRTRGSREKRFTRSLFGPGDLVFDVGANLGARTALYVELGARVVAVEPVAACVEALRERFANQSGVTIVGKALGEREGQLEIRFSPQATNMASLSTEWIDAMRHSERVSLQGEDYWHETQDVSVTTLDDLVGAFGIPAFCKIDVEGYEPQVLAGLSRPLPLLSFEFTPERPRASEQCIERLETLGPCEYNYSQSERARMRFASWMAAEPFLDFLRRDAVRSGAYGDIYATLRSHRV